MKGAVERWKQEQQHDNRWTLKRGRVKKNVTRLSIETDGEQDQRERVGLA